MNQAVSIVSGGGRGIGRAAALALAADGHRVCVNDTGVALDGRDPSPLAADEVVAEIRAAGGQATAVASDARTGDAARAIVAGVEQWAGEPPTVLVHAAGTLRDGMAHKSQNGDWEEVLGAHLAVGVELTRAMAPAIRAARAGRIVYVGGAAGLVGSVGQAAYAVAKAALFGLTRAVALEMAGRDVCVNYLVPFAYTRMTQSIPPVNDKLRAYLASAPAATPGDLASIIAWLCSDASSGVNGQIIGARGAEVSVWSQPRPLTTVVETAGWSSERLTAALPDLEPHFTPLESEFDLFASAPVAVTRGAP